MAKDRGVTLGRHVIIGQDTVIIQRLAVPDQKHVLAGHDKRRVFSGGGHGRQALFDGQDIVVVEVDHHTECLGL